MTEEKSDKQSNGKYLIAWALCFLTPFKVAAGVSPHGLVEIRIAANHNIGASCGRACYFQ